MKTNTKSVFKNYFSLITLLAACGMVGSIQAGGISGKITLKGTPPPEKTIDPSADPVCAQLHTKKFTTTHYVVGPDGSLANVFVYIKEGAKPAAPTGPAPVLDQEGCFYTPYVLGVQVNQPLKIKNSDPTLHNVHATPKVNKEFNFAQPVKGMVTERKFDKPEVLVRFKCDVHPWMFAFVGVVDHPYFAVTDKNGNFKIPNLPAGTYKIEAVHPKAGTEVQDLTIGQNENKTMNFTFTVK